MKQNRIFSVLILAVIALGLVVAACNTAHARAYLVTGYRRDAL